MHTEIIEVVIEVINSNKLSSMYFLVIPQQIIHASYVAIVGGMHKKKQECVNVDMRTFLFQLNLQ